MSADTSISWTHHTFFGPKHWDEPFKWNKDAEKAGERRRVFCASMADVFEDNEALEPWRAALWLIIQQTPHLDWQLLTKRPENIARFLPADWGNGYPNVWLGTTAENQEYADKRIPHLLAVPAVVRFLSCEPLLGPIDFHRVEVAASDAIDPEWRDGRRGQPIVSVLGDRDPEWEREPGIHWVIAGGESGGGARPMHINWARSLRDQCAAAGVAYFFKQWGEWAPTHWRDLTATQGMRSDSGHITTLARGGERTQAAPIWSAIKRVGKHNAGRLLDGVTHDAFPQPAAPTVQA